MPRRSFVVLLLACGLLLAPGDSRLATRASGGLPSSLSDRDFWQLSVDASEPSGYFRSENLTSNELQFEYVIPALVNLAGRARQARVYLGVGPEQNFTYISALRPSMAFIVDIRRGNLLLQLMYKALFEMSGDRAEFVSLLFSRPRPPGLDVDSTVTELFSKFADVRGVSLGLCRESESDRGPTDKNPSVAFVGERPRWHRARVPDVLRERLPGSLFAHLRRSDDGHRRSRCPLELSGH